MVMLTDSNAVHYENEKQNIQLEKLMLLIFNIIFRWAKPEKKHLFCFA